MHDHRLTGLFGEWCFGEKFGFECFGLSPFLFLFSAGWGSCQRTGFWLAIKRRWPLQVVVSFLSLFGCDYFVLSGYLSGPKTLLYNSFIFFRSLIGDFLFSFVFFRSLTGNFFSFFVFFWSLIGNFFPLFLFLPIFDREPFPFFVFFRGRGWKYSSRVKVYGGLRFWLKWLVEWLDMIYVRALVWPTVQG